MQTARLTSSPSFISGKVLANFLHGITSNRKKFHRTLMYRVVYFFIASHAIRTSDSQARIFLATSLHTQSVLLIFMGS